MSLKVNDCKLMQNYFTKLQIKYFHILSHSTNLPALSLICIITIAIIKIQWSKKQLISVVFREGK